MIEFTEEEIKALKELANERIREKIQLKKGQEESRRFTQELK